MAGTRRSAGILLFRRTPGNDIEVLLGHMGGPMWAKRPRGWTIPKGEYGPDEDPLAAARREFAEELGSPLPDVPLHELGEVRQSGGKIVTAWAGEADFDAGRIVSNTVEIEWPPRSGRRLEIPELDRAAWFAPGDAVEAIVAAQVTFVERAQRVSRGWK